MDQAISSLAQLLGLEDIRPGLHTLRNEKRWRIGELVVMRAWHALVQPSFHDRAAICVIQAKDTEFRGETFKGFLRAGIAIVSFETGALKQTVIADIDDDPLPQVVASLDLMSSNNTMCLDGIGYELNIKTNACDTRLRFANPTITTIQRIEKAFVNVVEQVARSSGEKIVSDFLKTWQEYLEGRQESKFG